MKDELLNKSKAQLLKEIEELRIQLDEANETIDAIRTGQVDALVVQGEDGHQLYTLKSADQTYRVFIEKMAEGAVTIDRNDVVLYCNSQFAEILNLSISQIIGSHFEDFVSDEDKATYKNNFYKGWNSDCKVEVNMKTPTHHIPVQLSVTTLDLEEGKSLSIIITDLTAQKATQKLLIEKNNQLEVINHALELSNHDLQQFASIASHDLQEPIRKIQIFSNFLEENETEMSEQSRSHLKKIINSSARMRTLVTEILNYSKLSAEEHEIRKINLNDIIAELRDHFELVIEEKKAQIKVGKLPVIEGNTGQIRQMFQNLISNALKFSREDVTPIIEIKARIISDKSFNAEEQENGSHCIISFQDNGIGFDGKYVENIFSLFERLNAKDKYEGAGIGLAIAKKIIEKHDGIITAESDEGKGANFQILLPLRQRNN